MTESLHTHLVSVLNAADVHPALSEDEKDIYPYVTFELPVEYRYDKDGPYKIVGNLTIRAVSDDFDEADALRATIEAAIDGGFNASPEQEPEDATEFPAPPVTDDDPVEEETEPADEDDVEPEPEDPEDPIVEDPEDPEPGSQQIPVNSEEPETDDPVDPVVEHVYSARLTDVRKDCMDGIWVVELDYILTQYE